MVSIRQPIIPRDTVQSSVTCLSQFEWMSNGLSQTPCTVEAALQAQCLGGSYEVIPLPNTTRHYSQPGTGTEQITSCSCSWAVYNLVQACTLCQFQDGENAVLTWNGWKTNCKARFPNDTQAYPPDVQIPDGTAVPFYALTDPNTWPGQEFHGPAAQQIQAMNKPDLTQQNREGEQQRGNRSKSIVGPAVGGAVGGFAVLVLLTILGLCIRRRHIRQKRVNTIHDIDSPQSEGIFGSKRPASGHIRLTSNDQNTYLSATSPGTFTSQAPSTGFTSSMTNPNSVSANVFGRAETNPTGVSGNGSFLSGSLMPAGMTMSIQSSTSPAPTTQTNQGSDEPPISPTAAVICPFVLPPRGTPSTGPEPGAATPTQSGILRNDSVYKQRLNPPPYSPMSSPEERLIVSMVADSTDVPSEAEGEQGDVAELSDERRGNRSGYPADRKR